MKSLVRFLSAITVPMLLRRLHDLPCTSQNSYSFESGHANASACVVTEKKRFYMHRLALVVPPMVCLTPSDLNEKLSISTSVEAIGVIVRLIDALASLISDLGAPGGADLSAALPGGR